MVKRPPNSRRFTGYGDIPWGNLEVNEKPEDWIIREIFEETSLKAEIWGVKNIFEYDFDNTEKVTHRFTVYKTSSWIREIQISHEHTDWKWATLEEISQLRVEPFISGLLSDK